MGGAGQVFHAALLGNVDKCAHPAGLLALGIDQRRFKNQHGKTCAILAHENRFMAFTRRRNRPRQPTCLATHVFLGQLWGPVGRKALAQQLFGTEAHHAAKRRVDIADAALQVARAQAGNERVFHRFAKCQRIAQIALCAQAAAVVPHQDHQHRTQGNRHGGDHGGHHIGKYAGGSVPAVHAQHHGVAR